MRNVYRTFIGSFPAILSIIFCCSIVVSGNRIVLFGDEEAVNATYIPLDSPRGIKMLESSHTQRSLFYSNSLHFVTQINQGYCGIASAVMTLNGVVPKTRAPVDPVYRPYKYFTQSEWVKEPCVKTKMSRSPFMGLTLEQEASLLSCVKEIDTSTVYADSDLSAEEMSKMIKNALNNDAHVIANILRTAIGEVGYGHFSPISAYHELSYFGKVKTYFLFMDVARYKYGPVWVEGNVLVKAMRQIDTGSERPRGFLIVTPGRPKFDKSNRYGQSE